MLLINFVSYIRIHIMQNIKCSICLFKALRFVTNDYKHFIFQNMSLFGNKFLNNTLYIYSQNLQPIESKFFNLTQKI